MLGTVIPLALACLSALAANADPPPSPGPTLYRFEKHVAAQASKAGESKLAAEAYFVGLLAVRDVGDEKQVEEFMTGGLLSDLGETLPPRPAGDPIRRAYALARGADVVKPAPRRAGLVVWTLPFEFFLTPRESPPEIMTFRHGVRDFASHASRPALKGTWVWRVESDDPDQGTYRISGPCTGTCDGGFPVGGCLARVMTKGSGMIREATASLSITLPISARLQSLADAPERKAEEERFFQGFERVVVHEGVRMHLDSGDRAGGIELPASLSTAGAKLRREADAK